MTATVVTEFIDGREAQHVACDCGWISAKLWADRFATVVTYWAEGEAASHEGVVSRDVRAVVSERRRLNGELARVEERQAQILSRLAGLAGDAAGWDA